MNTERIFSNRLDELKKQNTEQTSVSDSIKEGSIGLEGLNKAAVNVEHGLLQDEIQSNQQDEATDVIIAKGDASIFIVFRDESQD